MKKSIYTKKYQDLCSIVTEARQSKGLTQKQLSEKLDKPQSFVSKYENGERRIDVIEFIEICKALGIASDKIIKKL